MRHKVPFKLLAKMNIPATRVYKCFSLVSTQVLYQQLIEYLQYALVNEFTGTVLNHIYTCTQLLVERVFFGPPLNKQTVWESTNCELRLTVSLIKRPIAFNNYTPNGSSRTRRTEACCCGYWSLRSHNSCKVVGLLSKTCTHQKNMRILLSSWINT